MTEPVPMTDRPVPDRPMPDQLMPSVSVPAVSVPAVSVPEPAAASASAPVGLDLTGQRAVVVGMKGQMRGRFRRTVETLLDHGAVVEVVTIDSPKDFLAGFSHERLSVNRLPTLSLERALVNRLLTMFGRPKKYSTTIYSAQPSVSVPDPRSAPPSALKEAVNKPRRFFSPWTVLRFAIRYLRPYRRIYRWNVFWKESYAAIVAGPKPLAIFSCDLPGLVGASRAATELGVPLLHDCHELYLESTSITRLEKTVLGPIEKKYLHTANSVVCVNASIAREIDKRYGLLPVVIRNCAKGASTSTTTRSLRADAGLSATDKVVLYQGGISIGRGLEMLIRASAKFPSDTWLVMLGYGDHIPQLQALGERVGARVRFLPPVPGHELVAYSREGTIGVIPYEPVSLNNRLALPNKAFEFPSSGLPIVATAIPELLALQDIGIAKCFVPNSESSFLEAVFASLATPTYDAMKSAVVAWAAQNTWEKEAEILLADWSRVLTPALSAGDRKVV